MYWQSDELIPHRNLDASGVSQLASAAFGL
jgi:hypothetical protein